MIKLKSVFLITTCLCFGIVLNAQTPQQIFQSRLDSLLSKEFFTTSQIGLSVYNLSNDSSVFNKNEKLLLRPASVLKLLTTSAATYFLGTDYTFQTTAFHTGEIIDSVCMGDLYIVGGLDPDFTTQDLDLMIYQIKDYGIKEIRGNIYADVSAIDSLFWGSGWMWDDDPSTDAPYMTSLNINDNSVELTIEPGDIGSPGIVKFNPDSKIFEIKNYSTTIDSGRSTISVDRDWLNRNNTFIVKGAIPKTNVKDSESVNVYNPSNYFLLLLKERMSNQGLSVKGVLDTLTLKEGEDIYTLERNLGSVVINTNKISDNLSAEMLLRLLAYDENPIKASAVRGKKYIDSLITLCGLNPKIYRIVDGSGLSYYNLISAELLIHLFKYLYNEEEEVFSFIFNSLPISGVDGTLRNRMKGTWLERRVRAKTGTLSGVHNLAGFVHARSGNQIAFAILLQNFVGSNQNARAIQEKICQLIFEEL